MQAKLIPTNKVLARCPDNKGILWELPGEGVFLGFTGSVHLTWICSLADYQANHHVLVKQGWILEDE